MNLRSGYPFWLIKDGLPYNYPKLQESITTDVVILGGGISGALSGYFLNEAGVNFTVIDARSIGLGSTCASTSLLQYEIDIPLCELKEKIGLKNAVRAYQLCVEAIDQIKLIAEKLNFREFELKKSLYYAAYKKDLPLLKKEFAIRKENGFKVSYLNGQTISEELQFNAGGAILSECGAQIDAYAFTHALHQHVMQKGIKIYDRTPVVKIDHHKSGVTLVTENGYTVKARKIIYATGYEAVNFVDKKIVKLQSTYAVVSEQANEKINFWKDNMLLWNTANPYLYMRTTADNRIIIGGRDEMFFDAAKRDKLIRKKEKQLVNDFGKIFPHIPFKPEFSWTGTFGSTIDGLPFIGPYPKLPNSYFALGFGGNGITFSVIAAQILASLITGKINKDAGIFSFGRLLSY
jgi:glycine/D-amino acid oxidase-like deaminating enzyme